MYKFEVGIQNFKEKEGKKTASATVQLESVTSVDIP